MTSAMKYKSMEGKGQLFYKEGAGDEEVSFKLRSEYVREMYSCGRNSNTRTLK